MILNITVIGAGTMGNGIAHVFASSGFDVILCDIKESALENALATIENNLWRMVQKEKISEKQKKLTLDNIKTTDNLKAAVKNADLVIEAATENEALKLKIFRQIDEAAPVNAILATNTSSISVTKIAAATARPDKVIGMHFMNPVPVMKLIEVIKAYGTSVDTCEFVMDISRKLGKTPVEVNDYPGFIANRILLPMINEAVSALWQGVGGVNQIDQIMKLGMAHPMGPLQLADFIGLDICLSILNVLHEGFRKDKYAACPLLVNMVSAGKLGCKSGEGFYIYTKGSKELVVSSQFS